MATDQLNLSLEQYKDPIVREFTVTFNDLVEKIQDCNWEWHMLDRDSEEFTTAKQSYENLASCMDALRAKYYNDPIEFAKIKTIHNQHAPSKYHMP